MKTFKETGEQVLVFTAAGATVDVPQLFGQLFGIPTVTVGANSLVNVRIEGVFALNKTSAQQWLDGDTIYWNLTTSLADNNPQVGPVIGMAVTAPGGPGVTISSNIAAANPSSSGWVKLKGTPALRNNFGSGIAKLAAPAPLSVAGATTLTAAQVIAQGNYGNVVMDPGANVALTLPNAGGVGGLIPALTAAGSAPVVGDEIIFTVTNGADAAEVITITAGAGGTFDANQTAASQVIPQFGQKEIAIRLTNVGVGTEAYVVYA